jgi:hypothetical protein
LIPAVEHSAELARIMALPRRRLDQYDGAELSRYLTPFYATPQGMAVWGQKDGAGKPYPVPLKPVQAIALWEAIHVGGGFYAIPVGGGKTLICWLLPTVCQARRPLLILPAKLKTSGKTDADFRELSKFYVQPRPPIQIRTYSQLACHQHQTNIEDYAPDLIILDEAHKARREIAAVTKRLERYVKANPTCRVFVLTGTIMRHSLKDIAHLLEWSLKSGSPLPVTNADLHEWAAALDDSSNPNARRMRPGAILRLVEQADPAALVDVEDGEETVLARLALADRMNSTPGVIVTDDTSCDQPLTIDFEVCPEDPVLDAAFHKLCTYWELPDGQPVMPEDQPVSGGLALYRHNMTLSFGYFDKWEPAAPREWLVRRKAWSSFVREEIQNSARSAYPLDTPKQVALAYPDNPIYLEWKEIEPSFKPNSVPQLISATPIHHACNWIARQTEPTLIWVKNRPVGQWLAGMTGIKYYAAEGCAVDVRGKPNRNESVMNANTRQHAIVSIDSLQEGFNLQAWRKNFIIGMPQSGLIVEQLLGRTHRAGQERPVHATILVGSGAMLRAVAKCQAEAGQVRQKMRQTHKILRAEIDRSALAGWYDRTSLRWNG